MKTGLLNEKRPAAFESRWLSKALLASPFALAAAFGAPQAQAVTPIPTGTVMVSTGNGRVTEFTQTGTVLTQIDTTQGSRELTGSTFDSVGNFFVTSFQANLLSKFDPTGALVAATFAGPFNLHPESIVFDSTGDFYVGQADGTHNILKFDPSGTLIGTFAPTTDNRGTDWTELGADQCTLYYTSEGTHVQIFNACTNTQGPFFNVVPLPGPNAYAHRLLPGGGMLVADTTAVIRLDASGNQIHTYTLPGTSLFALNLDPDGTSFWTADIGGSNHVFKVDIASGTVLQNWNANVAPNFVDVGGLSVKGEIIISNPGPCGSGDAVLVNEVFHSPGTLTFDVSSPTRVLSSITLMAFTNIGSSTMPVIQPGGHSATGGSLTKTDNTKKATFTLLIKFASGPACTIDPVIKGHKKHHDHDHDNDNELGETMTFLNHQD